MVRKTSPVFVRVHTINMLFLCLSEQCDTETKSFFIATIKVPQNRFIQMTKFRGTSSFFVWNILTRQEKFFPVTCLAVDPVVCRMVLYNCWDLCWWGCSITTDTVWKLEAGYSISVCIALLLCLLYLLFNRIRSSVQNIRYQYYEGIVFIRTNPVIVRRFTVTENWEMQHKNVRTVWKRIEDLSYT